MAWTGAAARRASDSSRVSSPSAVCRRCANAGEDFRSDSGRRWKAAPESGRYYGACVQRAAECIDAMTGSHYVYQVAPLIAAQRTPIGLMELESVVRRFVGEPIPLAWADQGRRHVARSQRDSRQRASTGNLRRATHRVRSTAEGRCVSQARAWTESLEDLVSHAVQAVVGVVEIAAGLIIDAASEGALSTVGNALILAGAANLLGYAVSLLMNPHRAPLIPIGAAYAGTLERPAVVPETLEVIAAIYLIRLR
jgi:hypothetical protein